MLRKTFLRLHEYATGRHILTSLEDLNRSQWQTEDVLEAEQNKKPLFLLQYANHFVPYYRRLFARVGFQPEDYSRDPSSFQKIPVLTKSIIRENWDDLLTQDEKRRQSLSKLATSGSTGEPLVFMQDSQFRDHVTADIQRHLGWAGCGLGEKHVMIWGAPQKISRSLMLRRFLIDNMWNRFQLDAFALSDISLAEFAHRILREKPKVLFGYASSLYEFARYIRKHPEWNIAFRGIVSTSELLLSPVREYIESTFHCKIFDRYGTLELGGIGCECEAHTGLHISMENNYVEILTEGNLAKEGVNGDIVVTNLNNFGMPFIRYSIGDVGAWYAGDPCSCGRQSKRLKMVEGRLVDAFFTRDGRKVWSGFAGAGFRCLTHPTIAQFQIVQTSLDHMIVRLVPHGIITQSLCNEITNSIQIAFGTNVHTTIDLVNEIQPLASGKHQYAVSRMNEDIVLPDSHHKQATL